ncbi:MAG: recombination protein O N-terminal domain-containing protein [Spirochaetes bacterium]|nr:recombination protein O N-terminal domain-containing protein [Spirochaetota bacterium]
MILETRGLLLSRKPVGEYNERVSFYTRERGVLHAASFGSRSPKSRRRALLSGYDWLTIGLTEEGQGWRLEHLTLLRKNPFTESEAGCAQFLPCLKAVRALPEGHDPARFDALRLSWRDECAGEPPELLRFLFLHALLFLDGRAPSFELAPGDPAAFSWDPRLGTLVPGSLPQAPVRLGASDLALFNGLQADFRLTPPSFQARLALAAQREEKKIHALIRLCELMLQSV